LAGAVFDQGGENGVFDFVPGNHQAFAFHHDLVLTAHGPPVEAVGAGHPIQPAGIENRPFSGFRRVGDPDVGFFSGIGKDIAEPDHPASDDNGIAQ